MQQQFCQSYHQNPTKRMPAIQKSLSQRMDTFSKGCNKLAKMYWQLVWVLPLYRPRWKPIWHWQWARHQAITHLTCSLSNLRGTHGTWDMMICISTYILTGSTLKTRVTSIHEPIVNIHKWSIGSVHVHVYFVPDNRCCTAVHIGSLFKDWPPAEADPFFFLKEK